MTSAITPSDFYSLASRELGMNTAVIGLLRNIARPKRSDREWEKAASIGRIQ